MPQHRIYFAAPAVLAALCAAPAHARQDDDRWGGFYLGATAGSSWSDVSVQTDASPGGGTVVIPPADIVELERISSDGQNSSGFNGGIEAGYNWRTGRWLIGAETDFGFLDVKHARTNTFQSVSVPPSNATVAQDVKTEWMWTLRPRVGYVNGPWLVYATGGLATTRIKYAMEYADTRTPPSSGSASTSKTKNGWVAGLGAAYAFSPRWSGKAEWLYADFGHVSNGVTTSDDYATFANRAHVRANLVRIGVDARF